MAKYTIEDTTLTNIAEAIRTKGGATGSLTPLQMPDAINSIQGGGGGGNTPSATWRTPEEVYAQDRPSDWPVLPEPTQDGEFWFLMANHKETIYALPAFDFQAHLEWGYIDENGAFVVVSSYDSSKNSSWYEVGLGNATDVSKMQKYYVIHATGGDFSRQITTSVSTTTQCQYVLEIKARHSNPGFKSGVTDSVYNFPSCQFITLYGPQNWTDVTYKFRYMYSLRAILFDSEANNPFLKDITSITDVKYMFDKCQSLQCFYSPDNWSKITKLDNMYGSQCFGLLGVDCFVFETDRAYTDMSSAFPAPIRASIKMPNVISGRIFGTSSVKYFDNLDISSYNASDHSSDAYYFCASAIEVNNLKVGPYALTGSNVLYSKGSTGDTYTAQRYLQRVTMSPEQTGENMPTAWVMNLGCMSFAAIKEFLNSMPTVTGTHSLTICHTTFGRAKCRAPQELLEIATSKGYTISFTWYQEDNL